MCFVGHGAFGIITKEAWIRYFAVAGIGRATAYAMMPIIGTLDVTMGIILLVAPVPVVAWWMLLWALWTALLRPLAGESFWEMFERAGNYGVPAALLLWMSNTGQWRRLLDRGFIDLSPEVMRKLRRALTFATVLLLVGHGMLGLLPKEGQVINYASMFPPSMAALATQRLGLFEILVAAVVLVKPSPPLLLFVCGWKMLTEALFITAGLPAWEWVERGGSYAVPLALAMLISIENHGADVTSHIPLSPPPSTG
jgi:hypothetical protein